MKSKNFRCLLCIDFESLVISRKINKENLNDDTLRSLDNGYTLESLDATLNILKRYNQKITFFVVFKLEKLYPCLIEKILSHGHEVGWHGYSHSFLNSHDVLEQELEKSSSLISKYKIKGFQAPDIIFFKEGYKLLKKYGFCYSSSIYGNSSIVYNFDDVLEIPVSVSRASYYPKITDVKFPSNISLLNVVKFGIPYGSSYFWSILGQKYYEKKINEAKEKKKTINLFIHNWQLFPQKSTFPKYKTDEEQSFFRNPFYYPYTINVLKMFESLLSRSRFSKYSDYLKDIIS